MTALSETSQDLIQAYRLFFNSPAGLAVISDLMKFCKFRAPISDAKEEGMRQVFLRILQLSQLSDEQLIMLYAGRMIINQPEPQDE
ncbi:hypothetical protein [Bradyrhizobium sp. SZCCHNRI1073]|uniref:Bbp19 family protein n=1 Tax=Bradyrhizobium sp. SZCCHNRI1073 TaxID=3057280 RepID=UPI002916DEFB|nr:hypothetical protein [Bradyrhizobium sp. SZCCHNRI1073]